MNWLASISASRIFVQSCSVSSTDSFVVLTEVQRSVRPVLEIIFSPYPYSVECNNNTPLVRCHIGNIQTGLGNIDNRFSRNFASRLNSEISPTGQNEGIRVTVKNNLYIGVRAG